MQLQNLQQKKYQNKMDDLMLYSRSQKALIQADTCRKKSLTQLMILKIITPDENTKIKCMLNDIFNGVYQESSDKRD